MLKTPITQFALVAAAACYFTVACGDDGNGGSPSPGPDAGDSGGSSGDGGTGGAGTGGTGGSSGDGGAGGGAGTGGSSGDGSSGGADGTDGGEGDSGGERVDAAGDSGGSARDAGDAGSDADVPPEPECGDGMVDPGEQCDDANTENDDGCDAECTLEACNECRTANCETDGLGPASYQECTAYAGGAEGKEQCGELLACFRETGCAATDPRRCYCGDAYDELGANPYTFCFSTAAAPTIDPNGACADLIVEVLEAGTREQVTVPILNIQNPVGYASQLAICERRNCADECSPPSSTADGGTN